MFKSNLGLIGRKLIFYECFMTSFSTKIRSALNKLIKKMDCVEKKEEERKMIDDCQDGNFKSVLREMSRTSESYENLDPDRLF